MRRLIQRSKRRKEGDESIHEHRDALSNDAEETGTTRVNGANSHSDSSTPNFAKFSKIISPPATISSRRERSQTLTPEHDQSTDLPSIDAREQTLDSASPSAREGNVTSKDYWRLAIEEMQEDDQAVREQIAGVQQAATASGDRDFVAQLLHTTKERQQALEAKRWKITTRSGDWVLRDQLDRILKVVTVFKEMCSAAASLDPMHAGLPMAGFCVLMQMATSDSEQYAAMVAGVDEIVPMVARYRQVEELYLREARVALQPEFEQCLIRLYKQIVRYQISAACYYRHNTMSRFLRSLPKVDDLSDVIAAIRREDAACGRISRVFDASDARDRWDRLWKHLMKQTSSDSPSRPDFPRWTVARAYNSLFTGREDILQEAEAVIRDAVSNATGSGPCRIVITGMGGQGKSEICLQLAHRVRRMLWGIFWVDVSNATLAEAGYSNIATELGIAAQKLDDAKQALSNVKHPFLLVLDNADDPDVDYQQYIPDGGSGVVILTSRNEDCHQYATVKPIALEGLVEEEARELLLKAAQVPPHQHAVVQDDANLVADMLQSHPLALIQAGAYISRGHCTLADYPRVYERQRQLLLAFRPRQARSRYGDVYATFEASAELLKTTAADGTDEMAKETARDALELLPLLAVCGPSRLPLPMFEAAWNGAKGVPLDIDDDAEDGEVMLMTPWHVKRLPSLVHVAGDEWDSFRAVEAVQLLKSLALVLVDRQDGHMNVSMHALIHAWARDRQDAAQRHDSWLQMGCVMAFAADRGVWGKNLQQHQPHVEALTAWHVDTMFGPEPVVMVSRVLMRCGWKLHRMRADAKLFELMKKIFGRVGLDPGDIQREWTGVYDLAGRNLYNYGKVREAVALLERVVKIREQTLGEDHPARLTSQTELAGAYQANGQVKEAVALLERVVKMWEQTVGEEHPSRLTSQHALAGAYEVNGQVKEAMTLLERVVKIREQTLGEEHSSRLASQHALARAYQANGRVKEAVALLERVVKMWEQTVWEDHPSRLASQHELAGAYRANGQVKEAVALLERVVKVLEQTVREEHPSRLTSQHELAGAYRANGQVKEAVALLERVVKVLEHTVREEHPSRLASQHALAGAYRANRQVKEAVALLERVVKIREQTLEEEHPDRLASQHELAGAYRANGQVKEAITLLEMVVKMWEQTVGEEHPSRLVSQHNLAVYLWKRGERLVAHDMMVRVVEIHRRELDKGHPSRQTSEASLEQLEEELQTHALE